MSRNSEGSGVACPECGSGVSDVVDSRASTGSRMRRRSCGKCGKRFTTYEVSSKQLNEYARAVKGLQAFKQLFQSLPEISVQDEEVTP